MTREKEEDRKGEALEIFFHAGCQAIILGNHVETKGHYYWPYGHGPESLIEPPEEWWNYVLAKQQENIRGSSTKRSARRNQASRSNKRLLDPSPICGRHSGQGGSGLWCEQTDTGLILCMPGTTFNADPGRVLKLGEKINGYELVKRTIREGQDYLTFALPGKRKNLRQNNNMSKNSRRRG